MPLDIVLPISIKRAEKSPAAAPEPSTEGTHAAGYAAGLRGRQACAPSGGKPGREAQKQGDARPIGSFATRWETLHKEYESLLGEHLPDLIQGALQRVFPPAPFFTGR